MSEAFPTNSAAKWFRLETVKQSGWAFWLATALLFVFSLPHAMALRNVLLLVLLLLVASRLWGLRRISTQVDVRTALIALSMLMVWMLYVSVFVAPDPAASLRSFLGEWARALVVLMVGAGVALAVRDKQPDKLSMLIVSLIFFVGLLHMIGHDLAVLVSWIETGRFPRRFSGITDHRANVTFVLAMMLSAIGADVCSRYAFGRALLPGGTLWGGVAAALGLFALITASTTNGWIVSLFLVVTIFIVAIWLGVRTARRKSSKRITMAMGASAVIFVILGVLAVGNDPRYEGFQESVAIGWDTEGHRNWLNDFEMRDWPVRANGEPVDPSTYTRVAWAKEGAKLLSEHPWGTEIHKYTFARLISEKYDVKFGSHSHIGLIDFGLNVGIPGIVLWLIFLAALAWLGWSVTRHCDDAVGMCLFFLVVAFSARMMIDSILRDHMLEQFMFCVGMLMVACASSRQQRETLGVR